MSEQLSQVAKPRDVVNTAAAQVQHQQLCEPVTSAYIIATRLCHTVFNEFNSCNIVGLYHYHHCDPLNR